MDDIPIPIPPNPTRFMDQFRLFIRSKRLAYRTEKTYCRWVASYIRFHGMKHPSGLTEEHIESYLSHLAIERHVAVNTQKTALNALVFLYRRFLDVEIGTIRFAPAGKPRRLPMVFSHAEACRVLEFLSGDKWLTASLMYGAGLRIMESVRLRVQDVDFDNGCLVVRESKGQKWRRTLLPTSLIDPQADSAGSGITSTRFARRVWKGVPAVRV